MDEKDRQLESTEANASCDDASGALSQELAECSPEDQRQVMAAEQQRVAESAGGALPEMCLFDDSEPACPLENNETAEEGLTCDTPAGPRDFLGLAQKNFSRIDANADGHLDEDEVAAAVQNHEFKGEDARFVAALKEHQDELEELADDETGDENDGVTIADIEEFNKSIDRTSQFQSDFYAARAYAEKNFATLDSDGDGYLDDDELDEKLEDESLTDEQKAHLKLLSENEDEIEEGSDDETGDEDNGISREDMKRYIANEYLKTSEPKLVSGIRNSLAYAGQEAEKASTRSLYNNPCDPLADIKPEAVRQGGIGDCYFNSALASLAATDPQAIADMIQDNQDGTYTVFFPGAPDEPITVSKPTEQELALYSHGTEHGLWAPIMAKAYGQYCQESVFRRGPFNLGGGDTPAEGSDGGSMSNDGIRILTGKEVESDSTMGTSVEDLHETMAACKRDGKIMTAYINNNPFSDRTDAGYFDGHEYSVVDYNEETRTVTIRNPWGHGEPMNASGQAKDGNNDGYMTMTIEEFNENFDGLAYSE